MYNHLLSLDVHISPLIERLIYFLSKRKSMKRDVSLRPTSMGLSLFVIVKTEFT